VLGYLHGEPKHFSKGINNNGRGWMGLDHASILLDF
jgi:hypothetical protein